MIGIHWSESEKTRRFEARKGSYPGMEKMLSFHIVWGHPGHGIGESEEVKFDRLLTYGGNAMMLHED